MIFWVCPLNETALGDAVNKTGKILPFPKFCPGLETNDPQISNGVN